MEPLIYIVEDDEGISEVWGESFVGESRTIDMHIASLREKIKQAGGEDSIWFIFCQEKLLQC